MIGGRVRWPMGVWGSSPVCFYSLSLLVHWLTELLSDAANYVEVQQ